MKATIVSQKECQIVENIALTASSKNDRACAKNNKPFLAVASKTTALLLPLHQKVKTFYYLFTKKHRS